MNMSNQPSMVTKDFLSSLTHFCVNFFIYFNSISVFLQQARNDLTEIITRCWHWHWLWSNLLLKSIDFLYFINFLPNSFTQFCQKKNKRKKIISGLVHIFIYIVLLKNGRGVNAHCQLQNVRTIRQVSSALWSTKWNHPSKLQRVTINYGST